MITRSLTRPISRSIARSLTDRGGSGLKTFSESFAKADGDGLGPDLTWALLNSDNATWRTLDEKARTTLSQAAYAVASDAVLGGDNQWVETVVDNHANTRLTGLLLKAVDDALTFYQLAIDRDDSTGDQMKINRTVDGSATSIVDWISLPMPDGELPSTPYTLAFAYYDGTLCTYINGILIHTHDDSTLAANNLAGIYTANAANQMSSFRCGEGVYKYDLPLLSAGSAISAVGETMIPFRLASSTLVSLETSAPQTDDGDTVSVTITRQDNTEAHSESYTFDKDLLENLGADQDNVANHTQAISLPAGNYVAGATIGGNTPTGQLIRAADTRTGGLMSLGSSMHSSPWLMDDGDTEIIAGVSLGKDNPFFIREGSKPPVYVFDGISAEHKDRYHASIIHLKTSTHHVAFATSHNDQAKGISGPTIASLATATQHNVQTNETTYLEGLVDSNDNIWLVSRYAGGDGLIVTKFTDPSELSIQSVDYVTPDTSRVYPVGAMLLQKNDGGDLIAVQFRTRTANGWSEIGFIVLDPSVGTDGQWYNANGDTLGGTTKGSSGAAARLLGTNWLNDTHNSDGAILLGSSSTQNRYVAGEWGSKVVEWNASTKQIDQALVFMQQSNSGGTNSKTTSYIGIMTVSGSTRLIAWTPGGETNPFGLEPTNGYRGPTSCWFNGDDLIAVVADREERDREHYWDTDKTNLYYDMFGHQLSVFQVDDIMSIATEAALGTAVTELYTYSHAVMGGGVDSKSEKLGIANIKRIPGTNEVYMQVGINSLDCTEDQATVKRLDALTGVIT